MSDATYLTALAALAGSTIGGLTSLASAWLTQRHQDRAKQLLQEKGRQTIDLLLPFTDQCRVELQSLPDAWGSRLSVLAQPADLQGNASLIAL
jgi:hypothetical protein